MVYENCCICERKIVASDGYGSMISGRVHISCANGAENYVLELARINGDTLNFEWLHSGMINHFRDNREVIDRARDKEKADG